MKRAYIIPGWHPEYNEEPYLKIAGYFEKAGISSRIYLPDWSQYSVQEWLVEFLEELNKHGQPSVIFGFSMGAMLALIASSRVKVENLILCSPSGYFSEYISLLSDEDLQWAKVHIKDFEQFSAQDIMKNRKAHRGYILAGEKELDEWKDFKEWVKDLQRSTDWPLYKVSNMGHEVEANEYQAVIAHVITNL